MWLTGSVGMQWLALVPVKPALLCGVLPVGSSRLSGFFSQSKEMRVRLTSDSEWSTCVNASTVSVLVGVANG